MANRIELIHEDPSILVINKPAGLLSLPDRFDSHNSHLRKILEKKYGKLWIIHRLDRFTSGVMVLARNEDAHKKLNESFSKRKVSKEYLAIVHGTFIEMEGVIDLAIGEDKRKRGTYVIDPKGKNARTGWSVDKQWTHFSSLAVQLFTGRTHQIRVHLASLGHPIVADPLYSGEDALYLSAIKKKAYQFNRSGEERPLINRLALHSHILKFDHPDTGQPASFRASIPKDISAVINQLSKWD